jgi:hypothetical protein
MMHNHQAQRMLQSRKVIFIGILIIAFSGCLFKKDRQSLININIYGSYKKNDRIKVSIDHEVIFDSVIEINQYRNRRFTYRFMREQKNLKMTFSVNQRDTVFNYGVKTENYIELALSKAHNQFLISSPDSATYWKNGKD